MVEVAEERWRWMEVGQRERVGRRFVGRDGRRRHGPGVEMGWRFRGSGGK